MPHYPRAFVPSGIYIFTVVLLERRRSLLTHRIELLRVCFGRFRVGVHFASTRWRLKKTGFSDGHDLGEYRSHRRQLKHERGIWQRRFWEHVMRDQNDFDRHLDYIITTQ